MAESNGEAIPLGFIFTGSTDGKAASGAKGRALEAFLAHFVPYLPNLKFTLTDKELCEIQAFRRKFPYTKHQLCWWHAIRYIETRLSENRPPAYYNPIAAHEVFPFINRSWAPGVIGSSEDGLLDAESGGIHLMSEQLSKAAALAAKVVSKHTISLAIREINNKNYILGYDSTPATTNNSDPSQRWIIITCPCVPTVRPYL